jgi:uncharacterized SAM-binding protein YcdF (DUF218 family)
MDEWLLTPVAWLLVALLLGPLAWRARAAWLGAGCILLAVVAFGAMTPLVANSLLAYLEQPAQDAPSCRSAPPSTVVVLAGGVDRPPRSAKDFGVLNLASRRRMERAVQYWRERDGRELVIAGGPVEAGSHTHAELLGEYAQWLGVPEGTLRIENRSLNTRQNARNVAGLVPRLPRRIALVTSALHMPRARMAFHSAGFDLCPLPTDFRAIPVGPPGYLVPHTSALVKTEAALHELVGLGYYRWRDWREHRQVRVAAETR